MIQKLLNFYRPDSNTVFEGDTNSIDKKYRIYRWSVFLSSTIGYGIYYICRLSINVIKKPILDEGLFTESQLGLIGSALFFSYAAGKLVNGFLADRVNIRRFMATGLLVSAIINLVLGFQWIFLIFVILWAINGWFQSIGSTTSVVALVRWFSKKERGTYYGFGSVSLSLGEAITFIGTAFVVSVAGWRYGFWVSGLIGLIGSVIIFKFFHDSPGSKGLVPVSVYKNDPETTGQEKKSFSSLQFGLIKNPAIWILALAGSFIYVVRYAVNSWGILFLQEEKAYSGLKASSIISISSIFGIAGTLLSGLISDKLFGGKRNFPALIFGLLNILALIIFLNVSDNTWADYISMALFGISMGVLVCYLGGLMAIDISPKEVSGTVMGLIGIASYAGAGIQDMISGYLLEHSRMVVENAVKYDFTPVKIFWISSSCLSLILTLLVWKAKGNK